MMYYFLVVGHEIESYVSSHLENLFTKQTQPQQQSLKILSAWDASLKEQFKIT